MKVATLFNYFPMKVMVSIDGSPLYSNDSDVLKPYLEHDVIGLCPLRRGHTAYLGIRTRQNEDLSGLKLKM